MHLTDMLDVSCVKVPMAASGKREAIEELVALLADRPQVKDPQGVLKAVLEREATRTTGIGNGLAIPHGKCPAVTGLVMAIGKPAQPIDFDSIDSKPVSLIVLLASPLDQAGPHIQALARVSRLMTLESFRSALDKASSPQEICDLITRQEELLAKAQ